MKLRSRRKIKAVAVLLMVCTMMQVFFQQPVPIYAIDYEAEIDKYERELAEIKERQAQRELLIKEYKDDISSQQALYNAVEEQINEINQKRAVQESLINAKQGEIDMKIAAIVDLESEIERTELRIEEANEEIARLEEENAENLKSFGEIVKFMYMSENIDPISQLMGATDFFDLLVRAQMMKNVGEKNMEFMTKLMDDIEKQEQLKAQLDADILNLQTSILRAEDEKKEFEAQKAKLDQEKAELDKEVEAEHANLWNITAGMQDLRNLLGGENRKKEQDQAAMDEANQMIMQLLREMENPDATVYSSGEFLWPQKAEYQTITTYFGYDSWRSGNHYGIDIAGSNSGQPIYAAQSGVVTIAFNDGGWHGGFGNYVVVDHGDGVSTLYAHGMTGGVTVSVGQEVVRGQTISHVGSTGWATGPHLHFEVRISGIAVNPFNYKYENRDY